MGNDTERTESHTSGCVFVPLIFYTRLPSQDYYNNKVEPFFIIIRKYKLYYDNTVKYTHFCKKEPCTIVLLFFYDKAKYIFHRDELEMLKQMIPFTIAMRIKYCF